MRNPFAAIAVIATLSIFFSLALLPREWTYSLWLLLSSITRRTLGGPAPLLCHTPPSSRIPDTYLVMLANSYSLEKHKQTTGRAVDLERAILGSVYEFNDPLLGNITMYDVKSDDASLLDAIRADLGVLYVECEGRVSLRTHHVGSVQPTPLD
jgi:hypothetical protein